MLNAHDPIDPQLLITLVAIADSGSFSGAAGRIGRTESAVSMQMKRLEELVGDPPLFKRDGRRRLLASRGEALLAHARRFVELHEETRAMLKMTSLVGTVRLGAPEDYVSSLLPNALDRFASQYANVEVQVTCEPSDALSRLVADRRIDLAIVTRGSSGSDAQFLRSEPMVWVTSMHHAIHQESTVPLALFQPGCVGRALVIEALREYGRSYRIAFSSPSVAGLLTVVRAGLAVAALAKCSVPDDMRIITPEDGFPSLPFLDICLLQSNGTYSAPAVKALAAEIRADLGVGAASFSPNQRQNGRQHKILTRTTV